MHGRRGTGVERRKWGHSWYQSSVCIISFSSYPLYCCMHNWTKEGILFFPTLCSNFLSVIALLFSYSVSHRCHMWKPGSLAPHPLSLLLHTLSGPAGLCPDTSSRELKVTHGSSDTDDWLCPQASWRPPVAPAGTFCCFSATLIYGSAVRATGATGWLTSSLLTQSFTACTGNAGCVCVCGTVPVRQPAWYFLQGQQRLGQASIME